MLLYVAAKVIIINEFKTSNQVSTTSVSKAVNSLIIFQSPKYQIITKLIAVAMIVAGYFLNNCFANLNKTTVTIIKGNSVKAASTHLNTTAALPSKTLWV